MSMQDRQRILELEARVAELAKKLTETAESLAYLHGKVLGGPEATLPARGTVASEKIVAAVRGVMGRK